MKHRTAIFTILFLSIAGATHAQKEEKRTPPTLAQDVQRAPACPSDMIEVQGEYCPNVVQDCLNLDKSIRNANGYVRCLEFAQPDASPNKRYRCTFALINMNIPIKKALNLLLWFPGMI